MSEIDYRAILPEGWNRARGFSYGVVANGSVFAPLRAGRIVLHLHFGLIGSGLAAGGGGGAAAQSREGTDVHWFLWDSREM